MRFRCTDGNDEDFALLCRELDEYLNEIAGGESRRSQYIPYNKTDESHYVFLAYEEETPVGCAAFRHYDLECAEVKRVFVRKEYRGRGISKMLMKLLEEKAAEKGYSFLILESGEPLTEAMGLYKSMGYRKINNYGQYRNMKDCVCMKKKLQNISGLSK